MQSTITGDAGLDIVIGPMFSGKTTKALNLANIAQELGLSVMYINHTFDVRANTAHSTHNTLIRDKIAGVHQIKTTILGSIKSDVLEAYDIIIVDEGQFYYDLYEEIKYMVEDLDKRVVVFGLSGDFNREPMGDILKLIPICDSITKLQSFCKICAASKEITPAHFSHKLSDDSTIVEVGAADKYIPLCRRCYLSETKNF